MTVTAPRHVSPGILVDADIYAMPGADQDPHLAWKALDRGRGLVWTPRNGGHWIVTSAELMWTLFADEDRLSAKENSVPTGSIIYPLIPNNSDEPEHRYHRRAIMPFLLPSQVRALQPAVRALTVELIEGFRTAGRCEFMDAFARHLPMRIFLSLVDLPADDREWLMERTEVMVRSADVASRLRAQDETIGYLRGWIDERRARPSKDMLSAIIHARVGDRPMTEEEILGESLDVLFGGLDTVASMLGFIMRHLATHPDQYRELVDAPGRITLALEEMLRRFAVATTGRRVLKDVEHDGIVVPAGDMILFPTCLHALDEKEWDDPARVDFDRKRRTHATFGNGVHTCPGAGLARSEIAIVLEEWTRRIPVFGLDPERPPLASGGAVNGMLRLDLCWPTAD